jgi:hypothetical protein
MGRDMDIQLGHTQLYIRHEHGHGHGHSHGPKLFSDWRIIVSHCVYIDIVNTSFKEKNHKKQNFDFRVITNYEARNYAYLRLIRIT